MAYEMREGQGSLFKNEKQNDRQPDMRGSVMIEDKLYEIAAWEKVSQKGMAYMSLQVSPQGNYQKQTEGGSATAGTMRFGASVSNAPALQSAITVPDKPVTVPDPDSGLEPLDDDLPF